MLKLLTLASALVLGAASLLRSNVAGAQATTFNDAAWPTVNTPHTWNAADGSDGGNNYCPARPRRRQPDHAELQDHPRLEHRDLEPELADPRRLGG